MADNKRDESLPGIPIPIPAGSDGTASGGAQKYMSDTARAQQQVPPKAPSIYDLTQQAVSSIQLEDFKKAPLIPCFRESMLTSIGAGFAFGGIRLVMRGMFFFFFFPKMLSIVLSLLSLLSMIYTFVILQTTYNARSDLELFLPATFKFIN